MKRFFRLIYKGVEYILIALCGLAALFIMYCAGENLYNYLFVRGASEKDVRNFSALPADVRCRMIEIYNPDNGDSMYEPYNIAEDLGGSIVNVFHPSMIFPYYIVEYRGHKLRINNWRQTVLLISRDTLYYPVVEDVRLRSEDPALEKRQYYAEPLRK